MSVLVSSTQTDTGFLTNGARMGAVMSNGVFVIIAAASNTWGLPHYWTSTDSGATWTDRGAIPSPSTGGPDGTAIPAGMALGDIVHVSRQTISSQEKLCLWFVTGSSDPQWSGAGKPAVGYLELWYDGTNSFPSSRSGFMPAFNQPLATIGGGQGAAFYDGSTWYVGAIVIQPADSAAQDLYLAAGSPGSYKPALGAAAHMRWAYPGLNMIDVVATSGTMLVAVNDRLRQQLSMIPAVVSGTVVTPGTVEQISPETGAYGPTLALDGSNVDVLFVDSGNTLCHRKRTGLATYGGKTPIDAASTSELIPVVIRDTSGDLWVIYGNTTRQTNGEIKYSRLHGGFWSTPDFLAGGDAAGYKNPRIWGAGTSGASVTFTKGAPPLSLYYTPVSQGQAPGQPTGLTAGNVVSTTPTLAYTYVNSLSNDAQGWYQYQISHDAGTTIDYDSGQIAGSGHAVAVDPAAGLVIGTGAYWRVRTWDSLSSSGSGTAGPYSSWTAITPVRGGTVTITDVYSSGATSTTDITAPSHQVDGGWAQLDGHDSDMYQEVIDANDGVTLLATGTPTMLSPTVAAGGSFRTNPWNVLLTNGISVKVRLLMRDAVTGLWSQSSLMTYTITYAPPPAPTGLMFTPNSDLGYGTLAWTNDVSAVTAEVQMQDVTGTWIERSSGTLITSVPVHPACGVPYAYRVRTTDAIGNASTWTTITNQVLDGQGDLNLSIWLNDTETGDAVAVGTIDTESSLGLNQMEIERVFNPPGQKVPKTSYDATALWEEGDLSVIIMPNVLADGSITDVDATVREFEALVGRHFTCLWREPTGIVTYVKCSKFRREPTDAGLYRRVQFSIRETLPPKTPFL